MSTHTAPQACWWQIQPQSPRSIETSCVTGACHALGWVDRAHCLSVCTSHVCSRMITIDYRCERGRRPSSCHVLLDSCMSRLGAPDTHMPSSPRRIGKSSPSAIWTKIASVNSLKPMSLLVQVQRPPSYRSFVTGDSGMPPVAANGSRRAHPPSHRCLRPLGAV